jgi:CHAT domain-containing protein
MRQGLSMNHTELAAQLVVADDTEREMLLTRRIELADATLAHILKDQYDEARTSDPARAGGAAATLMALAAVTDEPEVQALAAWTAGRTALQIEGQMEQAIAWLDAAVTRFEALKQPDMAAAVQVNRLHALAMLGHYDEAIACGLQARDVLLTYGNIRAVGQIEQNLGNIYGRRGHHHEAEQFFRAARGRYLGTGDQQHLARVENSLAYTLSLQHKFRDATVLYEQALARAEAAGLIVTQAEIECNLGNLALFQGRYDRALDYLERSRRKYATLQMPHESAIAEQELANAYLELNLAPEAVDIYAHVVPTFAELGMRAEQALALANHGYARLLMGHIAQAQEFLHEAHVLYAAEGNAVGAAMVTLAEARLAYTNNDFATAATLAAQAEGPLAQAQTWGQLLHTRWLQGEAERAEGKISESRAILEAALRDAELHVVPQIVQRCHTSLGLLAASTGEIDDAEAAFQQAVGMIEALRAPLPAEEFRTAFFADKLTPYTELVRLCLTEERRSRIEEALGYVERARSRALVEMLGKHLPPRYKARDPFEAELLARLEELREELNWFYNQVNRMAGGETLRSAAAIAELDNAVREREAAIAEINRQLNQRSTDGALDSSTTPTATIDIAKLQRDLGTDTALVEYFSLDGELLAFIVTDQGVNVVRNLAHEEQIEEAVTMLRFQTDTLRHGRERMHSHMDRLAQRASHYLQTLYDLVLGPLEAHLGERRLVVVPYRALHYIPFHALYDGTAYVIERREVCYAPSAKVLELCLARPQRPLQRAVLFGVPDEHAPRVRDEVEALASLFPETIVQQDTEATRTALRTHAAKADVLHLACHGQFRPDNPLFSALQLGDGWLTVRDTYDLDLNCELVTLSACETGVNAVAPGDELIGLARGFFSAGAPTLLVSLWTVDDDSTAALMHDFYTRMQAGERPAAALRNAQRAQLEHYRHPFFWSPFVLLGRW